VPEIVEQSGSDCEEVFCEKKIIEQLKTKTTEAVKFFKTLIL
jgi:hypothetical protein